MVLDLGKRLPVIRCSGVLLSFGLVASSARSSSSVPGQGRPATSDERRSAPSLMLRKTTAARRP
jgi:hypothetical protein